MHGDGVGYTTSPYYFYCLLSTVSTYPNISPRRQSFVSEIWNLYKRAETKLAKCGPQTCPVLAWQHQGPPTDALSGHLTFSIRKLD